MKHNLLLKTTLIALYILACYNTPAHAKIKFPVLIADGMVLQQQQPISLWGWADPGETVTISFLKKSYHTTADVNGKWKITLPALKAGGPHTMQINDTQLKDILIGDVFLCSGQSNMELPISRVTDLFREEVKHYSNPMIRYVKTPLSYNFHGPQEDVNPVSWKALTPENAMSYSALVYFFARDLYDAEKVPIGIINSSVGGSPVEAWISEEGLKPFPKYLNDRQTYRSDTYLADLRKTERKRRDLWNNTLYRQDAGLYQSPRWYAADYNDTSWQQTDLFDTSWNNNGLNPENGSFWFRKEFNLSQSQATQNAVLRLGCIVDADSVYVNGTFVGTTSYQYPPRIYTLPQGLLKPGKNTVTIRLISYDGRPHFVRDKPYKIIFNHSADNDNKGINPNNTEEIVLTGNWKYQRGAPMPALPGETFLQYKPTGLYNAMIAPLQNFKFKAALWYQGESNTGKYNEYSLLLSSLIADWREKLNNPSLPFFIAQLPNFMEPSNHPTESQWSELRDVQLQVARNVPDTWMSVNIDLGEWNDIHPLNKKDVAKRLSLLVQKHVYGNKNIISSGPLYKSKSIEGNQIILSFEEGTDDLEENSDLKRFSIAGADGKFKWAKARTEGNKVIVWNEEINNPVMVRYAWENNPEGANLRNKAGLPASPFRTDK